MTNIPIEPPIQQKSIPLEASCWGSIHATDFPSSITLNTILHVWDSFDQLLINFKRGKVHIDANPKMQNYERPKQNPDKRENTHQMKTTLKLCDKSEKYSMVLVDVVVRIEIILLLVIAATCPIEKWEYCKISLNSTKFPNGTLSKAQTFPKQFGSPNPCIFYMLFWMSHQFKAAKG